MYDLNTVAEKEEVNEFCGQIQSDSQSVQNTACRWNDSEIPKLKIVKETIIG